MCQGRVGQGVKYLVTEVEGGSGALSKAFRGGQWNGLFCDPSDWSGSSSGEVLSTDVLDKVIEQIGLSLILIQLAAKIL